MPTLHQWLERIQALHPREIDLGLQRVREVASRLGVCKPAPIVVTVAGTNGKGSTVAMLDAILRASGRRVGTCTSPHLHVYNERVALHGQPATDAQLCAAFEQIEAVRGDISLTYFEYSTLAGLWLIAQERVDVAVLEIGLGGRLDAINLVDPDIAIITSIGLDHMEWLGDSREAIGREKAGIFRANTPALCGDIDPPVTVLEEARRLRTPLLVQGVDFGYQRHVSGWHWWGRDSAGNALAWNDLPLPALDLLNAATVLQALQLLPSPPPRECVCTAIDGLGLQGRYQRIEDPRHPLQLRVDVAHNPHAAALLREKLQHFRTQAGGAPSVHVVLAMMADKDQVGFYKALESAVDFWYIAAFDETRGLSAQALFDLLHAQGARVLGPHVTVAEAYEHAVACAGASDLVLVTGSFVTVADVVRHVHTASSNPTPSVGAANH
jgi:dihydrofolate synthase/folylpolyglutamate synthase